MINSPSLNNRIAVVTGGGQGLGAAICLRLALEGADVVVADLNEANAQMAAAEAARASGRRTLAIRCDVTSEAQVQTLMQQAVAEFGRIDILVANAGILISGPVEEFPLEKWQAVINVNLVGYFLCAKHVVPIMKQQRSGSIIQINSKSGKKGSYKNSAYAASKFAGIGLTQSIALELAEFGVRVNAICPGNLLDSPLWKDSLFKQFAQNQGISEEEVRKKYVDQVPMKRPCTYEDVCNIVAFLASDQSSYMTGQAINVTGGQEMR
jgi:sorbitol-6-phosphate 2-dehydrogenase